jgi:hypothetical protein
MSTISSSDSLLISSRKISTTSAMDGRLGLSTKDCRKRVQIDGPHLSSIFGRTPPSITFLPNELTEYPSYGVSNELICHKRILKEKTSAVSLYGFPSATSGAMYRNEPVSAVNLNVPSSARFSGSSSLANPKSKIFTSPTVDNNSKSSGEREYQFMKTTMRIVEKELKNQEKPNCKLTSYIKSDIVWLEIAIKDAARSKMRENQEPMSALAQRSNQNRAISHICHSLETVQIVERTR